jgi:hypothetical protein
MPEKMKALYKPEYVVIHDADGNELERRPPYFLEGVPARHLTQEDFDALTDEQKEAVRKSGLYDVRTEEEMRESTGGRRRAVEGSGEKE